MGQRVLLIFFQKAVPSSGFHLSRWKQQTPLDSSHFLLLHHQNQCHKHIYHLEKFLLTFLSFFLPFLDRKSVV